ncbi:hypothetical protein Q9K01_13165 [Qipengyuania sp. DY56-A-20]|uniref:Phytanoyl-CoA dioxygenase n=1 Tax=Qipengyuania benthica TaxID=3067651 RepID=A0ABT9HB62_9SPHN|nr:hypothetical protein [Qipengyuania sp. DY56-A-20]MDP4540576.1 hypothetical protein [Qipengyuania sp. DY56-A-20]
MGISLARRLAWHAYRTPLANAVKRTKQLTAREEMRHRKSLLEGLPLNGRIEAAVNTLKQDGFVRLDELVDPSILNDLKNEVDSARAKEADAASSAFGAHKAKLWSHAIDSAMVDGQLPAGSAFARAAMQPAIVSVLARTLGMVPRLDYVTVTESKPMLSKPSYSQLWHRDYDDTRVLKYFIYLSDVEGVEDGPFTFLPAPVSDKIGFSLKSHRSDTDLPAHVNLERDKFQITGPQFSCFAVETSRCLHMGSRVHPGHGRLMYTATFFAPPRLYPEPVKPFFLPNGGEKDVERAMLFA